MTRFRTGRRNPRNIYLQRGNVPSDDDRCVAFAVDPDEAGALVALLNATSAVASSLAVARTEIEQAGRTLLP